MSDAWRGERWSGVLVGVQQSGQEWWGYWLSLGELCGVYKDSPSGSGLVPPLATSQAQAALPGSLYPWNFLGNLSLARHLRNGVFFPLPTRILSFSLKELMDCFSPTPSFSNKRFP